MPTVDIQLKGLEEVERRLRKLPANVERRVLKEALLDGGKPMLAEAQRRAPVGMPRRHPKSTPLRDALTLGLHKTAKGLVWVRLGVDYTKNRVAHLVEFGHRLVRGSKTYGEVRPHPFIRPSYDATKREVVQGIERNIVVGVEREAGKLGRGGR